MAHPTKDCAASPAPVRTAGMAREGRESVAEHREKNHTRCHITSIWFASVVLVEAILCTVDLPGFYDFHVSTFQIPVCYKIQKKSLFRILQNKHNECHDVTGQLVWVQHSTAFHIMTLSRRNSGDPTKKKQHICHMEGCGKVYGKTSHLRAHLRWHTGERPFVCNWIFCGKRFTRSDELQRHRRTHTGREQHLCKGARFFYSGILFYA